MTTVSSKIVATEGSLDFIKDEEVARLYELAKDEYSKAERKAMDEHKEIEPSLLVFDLFDTDESMERFWSQVKQTLQSWGYIKETEVSHYLSKLNFETPTYKVYFSEPKEYAGYEGYEPVSRGNGTLTITVK